MVLLKHASRRVGATFFCAEMDRSQAIQQSSRTHDKHNDLRFHVKVLTVCTYANAETMQSNSRTLADFSAVASLCPDLHNPNDYFTKLLQRFVYQNKYLILKLSLLILVLSVFFCSIY